MNNNDIFEQARKCISESLIRSYFSCNGSWVSNNEYFILSPLRADNSIGSFCINLKTGAFIDNARTEDKGDFITLVSRAKNISLKEAAEMIVKDSGGTISKIETVQNEKEKIKAVIPIPESVFDGLKEHSRKSFITDKIGEPVKGWKYATKDGVWCIVMRHEKNGEKNVKPYFYGVDGKWHSGNPIAKNRPPFNMEKFDPSLPIVISEGEKCASIELDGYNHLGWIGGTGQILLTDWYVLKDRKDVTFIADNDEPGFKCAKQLKEKYPDIKIIAFYDKRKKYDIADAVQDGIDIIDFIKNCKEFEYDRIGIISDSGIDDNSIGRTVLVVEKNTPFQFLGYSETHHYFLPRGSQIVRKISAGSVVKSKLLELADLAWWCAEFPKNTKGGGIEWDAACDFVIRSSERAGMYNDAMIRGAGVWSEADNIVVNTGTKVETQEGENHKSDEYKYVKSTRNTGSYKGTSSTDDQGMTLIKLFKAQEFETDIEALCCLGWSLLAPFGGLFPWRPNIWVTGDRSSGKSTLMERIIAPIVGDFSLTGSGKSTAASIYRSLKQDSCPVLFDEMEPSTGATKEELKNISEIVEIARNGASNFSAKKSLVGSDGIVETFTFKSFFCFASIVPYLKGSAIESRFIICNLKKLKEVPQKIKNSTEILESGILDDPSIFRKRVFRNLQGIMKASKLFHKALTELGVDQRDADNYAPLISAVISITMDVSDTKWIKPYAAKLAPSIKKEKVTATNDEDKLLNIIFDYSVRTDEHLNMSIGEMIYECSLNDSNSLNKVLMRYGVRIYEKENKKYLTIANENNALSQILKETAYGANHSKILKRHPAYVKFDCNVRYAGKVSRSIFLEWKQIKDLYFTDDDSKLSDIAMEVL